MLADKSNERSRDIQSFWESGRSVNEEVRKSTGIKLKPSIVRKARVRAVLSDKTLGKWFEEVIDEKAAREEKEEKKPK